MHFAVKFITFTQELYGRLVHSIYFLCAGRCFLIFFFTSILLYEMSVIEEVAALLTEAKGVDAEKAETIVNSTVKAVGRLLSATGETFAALCQAVECATGKDELKSAFQKFNAISRFLSMRFRLRSIFR